MQRRGFLKALVGVLAVPAAVTAKILDEKPIAPAKTVHFPNQSTGWVTGSKPIETLAETAQDLEYWNREHNKQFFDLLEADQKEIFFRQFDELAKKAKRNQNWMAQSLIDGISIDA